jgi:hypothetical protein
MGPMFRTGHLRPSALAPTVASLAIVLVLALTVFSASPELHGWLHGHERGATDVTHHDQGQVPPDDDGCVVTLFAQGLVLTLALVAFAFTGQTLRLLNFARGDRILPEAPRYLRLPTQAPPFALS